MQGSSQPGVQTFVNGQPATQVSVTDRGLAFGDGVFETIRFRNGQVPAWPYHLQRLLRGLAVLQILIDRTRIDDSVSMALDAAAKSNLTDGVLKLIVTRGTGGRGYIPPAQAESTLIVMIKPYEALPLFADSDAVALKACEYRLSHNPRLAKIKHLNRLEHILAAQSVDLQPGQQGLISDSDGYLVETLHHNLFLVRDGHLVTPELARCGVEGVLRAAIIEFFGPQLAIPVVVENIRPSDLQAADEVFICNSVHGITPVIQWQNCSWPTGELTRQLMHTISQQWKGFYDR